MARTIGSIAMETLVTVPVTQDCVMTARGKKYVFIEVVRPKIYEASRQMNGDRKMYDNFIRACRQDPPLYNIVTIYGLPAINIDEPQDVLVSVRLKFIVTAKADGMDCTLKNIKKQPKQ